MSTNRFAARAPTTVSFADEDAVKRIVTDTLFGLRPRLNNLTRLGLSKRERYRELANAGDIKIPQCVDNARAGHRDRPRASRALASCPRQTAMTSEPVRTGLAPETLSRAVLDNLACLQARFPEIATHHDWYMALAYSVRDRMLARWVSTVQAYAARDVKVACYLSAEFLIGPQLGNNLVNLGIEANAREAMRSLGQELDTLLALEEEPGLGNGGLGRLAACYMDSLATLEVPAIGYGIRYEFGIFDQSIRDGWQVEVTDKWLQQGNPWEIVRSDVSFYVRFGGRTRNRDGWRRTLSRALDRRRTK